MGLTLFLYCVTITTVIIIFYLVRENRLHLSYSLFWIVLSAVIALLGFFPGININIAKTLGVQYYPILPIILAILVIFIKILKQDIELTKKEIQIKRLIQEIALLKEEIKKK